MGNFHFDLGNSNDGPIGFSAEIKGVDTGAAALDALRAALPEHAEIKGFDDDRISYVTVYFNGDAISVRDIDESETDDGEGCCEYCGRSEDEPHTDDCESALAQDLSLGEITIKDDSYTDAVSAFETVYGRPFIVTNAIRAAWAKQSVRVFQNATGAGDEDALGDLLCDLMHLYGAKQFAHEARRARFHYRVELREDAAV